MNNLFVFDTNSLISATLIKGSVSRKALDKALNIGELAISNSTLEELIEVLFRKKFDKYFMNDDERLLFINKIEVNAKLFEPKISFTLCRDPKDNKFLELAISAKAACIITGDEDLLVLNPFCEIPILNAAYFLNNF